MDIEDIEKYFCRDSNWFDSFSCPNCSQIWGPSSYGDPPAEFEKMFKCECDAILWVSGEWVSHYKIDVEQLDDEA